MQGKVPTSKVTKFTKIQTDIDPHSPSRIVETSYHFLKTIGWHHASVEIPFSWRVLDRCVLGLINIRNERATS